MWRIAPPGHATGSRLNPSILHQHLAMRLADADVGMPTPLALSISRSIGERWTVWEKWTVMRLIQALWKQRAFKDASRLQDFVSKIPESSIRRSS